MIHDPLSSEQLKLFVEQLENLNSEKNRVIEAINDLLTSAKALGYDPEIIKEVNEIYKLRKEASFNDNDLFDLYKNIERWAGENQLSNSSK